MVIDHYLSIIAGVVGAVVVSQLPGFTLQYMHNLNGRLDELTPIVEEFKADLLQYNYTVEAALQECEISDGLLDALCESFEEIVIRYEILIFHYETLAAESDYSRPFVLAGTAHMDILESVMEEFKPAVPVDDSGLIYAGVGFLSFWIAFHVLLWLLCLPCRRSRGTRSRETKQIAKEQQLPQHRRYDANFL